VSKAGTTRSGAGTTARPDAAGVPMVQLVVFRVGTEEYGLDILRIKEIINPLRITPVPRAPAFVEGVVELRGTIVPVVDMRKRFDLPATPLGRRGKYVIVGIMGRVVGLVVDGVAETLRVPRPDVKSPPELFADALAAEFFDGVCYLKGRILFILNLDKILTSQERLRLGAVAGAVAKGGGGAP
jgi:purine-binding chemotaxis protein CheW